MKSFYTSALLKRFIWKTFNIGERRKWNTVFIKNKKHSVFLLASSRRWYDVYLISQEVVCNIMYCKLYGYQIDVVLYY